MKKQCEVNNIAIELPQKRVREEVKPEPVLDTVSVAAKLEFAEKIRKVNHEVLADIVKTIESENKNALEELDPDRLEIKVDILNKSTFEKLLRLVNSAIDDSKAPKKHKNSIS